MKSSVTFLAAVGLVSASKLYPTDAESQQFLWREYKQSFSKSYEGAEDDNRLKLFLENLRIADQRNVEELRNGGSAVHGITRFSDISQSDFEAHYLKSDRSMKTDHASKMTGQTPNKEMALVDWSGKLTTPVKDQGYCGSCWAFSATEQIETDAIRTLGVSYILSPQQITSCDKTALGCSGGWTEHAYNYVTRAGGIEQNSDYPYSSYNGITGQCAADPSKFVLGVTSYTTVVGEPAMAAYVQQTGPLSVCLDASQFNSYTSGILSVCTQNTNHCVQASGVDVAGGFWKVRNSWGTSWGESGYIRLAYGVNICAITEDPTWVTVFKV